MYPANLSTTPVMHANGVKVKHAVAMILHNLDHDELSVGALASSLHLSPSHLRRLVLSATRMTPVQLIKHYRLERACELLADALSVKEISHSVGLHDVSHFVRDFKRKYGLRPSEYRNRLEVNVFPAGPGVQVRIPAISVSLSVLRKGLSSNENVLPPAPLLA